LFQKSGYGKKGGRGGTMIIPYHYPVPVPVRQRHRVRVIPAFIARRRNRGFGGLFGGGGSILSLLFCKSTTSSPIGTRTSIYTTAVSSPTPITSRSRPCYAECHQGDIQACSHLQFHPRLHLGYYIVILFIDKHFLRYKFNKIESS
jgi:hypothetical protein